MFTRAVNSIVNPVADFFDFIYQVFAGAWKVIGLVYAMGVMGLTFFQINTGLHMPWWLMYLTPMPLLIGGLLVLLAIHVLDSEGSDPDYTPGLFVVSVVTLWPMLVWHMFTDTFWWSGLPRLGEYLLATRFIPLVIVSIGACGGAFWKLTKPKSRVPQPIG